MSEPPSTEEILAEVERRRAARDAEARTPTRPLSVTERRFVLAADRVIFFVSRHWLVIFNLAALLYIGLSVLAPVLMHLGVERPGQAIYAMYAPLCHQLPDRSFFLFGPRLAYSYEEMWELVGAEGVTPHGFIGSPELGYKIALCQRDVGIYSMILLAGLAYGLVRKRLRPLPFWAYILFGIVPIGVDGGLQMLFGRRGLFSGLPARTIPWLSIQMLESGPVRRIVTGALFGLATIWLAYPYVEEAFVEIRKTLEQRFGDYQMAIEIAGTQAEWRESP